jgi:hypothetical protein
MRLGLAILTLCLSYAGTVVAATPCEQSLRSYRSALQMDISQRAVDQQDRWSLEQDLSNDAMQFVDELQYQVFLVMMEHAPEFREEEYESIGTQIGISHDLIRDMELFLGVMIFEDLSFVSEDPRAAQFYLERIVRQYRLSHPKQDSAESRYLYYLHQIGALSVPQIAEERGATEFQVRSELSLLRLSIEEELSPYGLVERYQKFRVSQTHDQAVESLMLELGYDDDQGIRYYLSYVGERNRGRPWSELEREILRRHHSQGSSIARIVEVLNRASRRVPGDDDYRSEGAVAYQLDRLDLVQRRSKNDYPHTIAGYGTVLNSRKQLEIAPTKAFLYDHWDWPLLDLARALHVEPQTVHRFALRHDIALVSLRQTPLKLRSILVSDADKEMVRQGYQQQRAAVQTYAAMSFEQISSVIDDYVASELGGDRDKLITKHKKGAKIKIATIWAHYGFKLAKIKGERKEDWNKRNIHRQPGYSAAELLVYYRRCKGDSIGDAVDYTLMSFDQIVTVIDEYVASELGGDRDELSTYNKKGFQIKIANIWKQYGLKLAEIKGERKDDWNTNNIHSQPGYGTSELLVHYRRSKGDSVEDVVDYSLMSFDQIVAVIDEYVASVELGGDRKKLSTENKKGSKIKIQTAWRHYGLKLGGITGERKEDWNTGNIHRQPGYSAAELLIHYRRSKGDSFDDAIDYHSMSFDQIVTLVDQYVTSELGDDREKLGTHNKKGSNIKIATIWKHYGLKFADIKGERKEDWNTANILRQPGYFALELLIHYRRSKGDSFDDAVDYQSMSFDQIVNVIDRYVAAELGDDRERLGTNNKKGANIKIVTIWKHYGLKLAEIIGERSANWYTNNIFKQPGYAASELVEIYKRDAETRLGDTAGSGAPLQ